MEFQILMVPLGWKLLKYHITTLFAEMFISLKMTKKLLKIAYGNLETLVAHFNCIFG